MRQSRAQHWRSSLSATSSGRELMSDDRERRGVPKWLRLRVWLKVLRIGRLLYAHVVFQQRLESRDRGMRTKLRWSKRKLVLDLGSQNLSSPPSASSSSPPGGTRAASLTIDYPKIRCQQSNESVVVWGRDGAHLMLPTRDTRSGKLREVVLLQGG